MLSLIYEDRGRVSVGKLPCNIGRIKDMYYDGNLTAEEEAAYNKYIAWLNTLTIREE